MFAIVAYSGENSVLLRAHPHDAGHLRPSDLAISFAPVKTSGKVIRIAVLVDERRVQITLLAKHFSILVDRRRAKSVSRCDSSLANRSSDKSTEVSIVLLTKFTFSSIT